MTDSGIGSSGSQAVRPFLRWAGGKRWLVPALANLYQLSAGTYYEPFLGGGSVFFGLQPPVCILADLNNRLVETYKAVADNPGAIVSWLSQWPNTAETYDVIREDEYRGKFKRAAQFIYLNKTCWNGLYRVDRSGKFNVPYGKNTDRATFDRLNLASAAKLLRRARIVASDFEDVLAGASEGDFVYLDPPYTVLHSDNGFRRYNERLFSWDDQKRLADVAHRLAAKGCHVAASNASHPDILRLYSGFEPVPVERKSLLASSADHRHTVQEVLFLSPLLLPPMGMEAQGGMVK